jgi:hypothetical protein
VSTRSKWVLVVVLALFALLAVVMLRSEEIGRDRTPRIAAPVEPRTAVPPPPLAAPRSDRVADRAPAPPTESASGGPTTPGPSSTPGATSKVRIHGRVVADNGSAVVGADVEVHAWSGKGIASKVSSVGTRTDAVGAFEIEVDRDLASSSFVVVTGAEGYLEGARTVDWTAYDETRGVDVEVESARAITGRVLDADAKPIPGTTVLLWYGSETTWPTPVDAEGRFRTPARGPRRAFELLVWAPAFPRRGVPVAASTAEVTDVGDLVLRRGGTLAGLVVDMLGEPVQDLGLELDQVPAADGSKPRTRTDSRGRFEFADLGLGTVSVHVAGPGGEGGPPGARRPYRGGVGPVEVGRRDVRIVAESDCALVLRFVDVDTGKPVSLRKVEYGARYEGTPPPEHPGQSAESSIPFPSVRLTVATGRRYDVTVRAPEFEVVEVTGIDVRDLTELTIDVRLRKKR